MASNAQKSVEQQQQPPPKLQIYSSANSGISAFWREKYERDAKKYWDVFYKHHQDRFFKDRHYLDKEWGSYFSGAGRKVILEVGCGVGNTVFPLIATYPEIFVHACDFSPRAINLVKVHKDFIETRVNAFVCDLTADDLSKQISPSSIDIVTMIFVLSAVSPEKMPLVLQNIKKVLKPNGCVLFRDYATGDLAQERLICKDQKISENFYVRGDGTRAFYFCDEFLMSLFKENGFDIEEHGLCCKQVENRSREIVMNRRWVQAVFRVDGANLLPSTKPATEADVLFKESINLLSSTKPATEADILFKESINPKVMKEPANDFEIDMSEGMAVEMFGTSPSSEEIVEVNLPDMSFKIKELPREYQHTCKSTGLMLWESARFMASVLAVNPNIVSGKRVLELGCGCGGICSMVSARSADLVVATDGDTKALDLLTQNVVSNLKSPALAKLIVRRLEWGNRDHIKAIKELNDSGFDVIIGTDITYIPEAISPLFATARELLSSNRDIREDSEPALILCHVFRRVDEPSILSTASEFGFRLVDKWPAGFSTGNSRSGSIVSTWFSDISQEYIPNSALNIMYFQTVK